MRGHPRGRLDLPVNEAMGRSPPPSRGHVDASIWNGVEKP